MKGLLILRFNRSPGAYIAYEYPEKISDRLNMETSDLMNIYGIHRHKRIDPNYNQLKIKGLRMASFYTGYTLKDYIGLPDIVVTVLLDEEDALPRDFEWILRNFAHLVLPKMVGENFEQELKNQYNRLKKGEIEPFPHEEEIAETPAFIASSGSSNSKDLFAEIKTQFESSIKGHILELEKESLDNKIIQLNEIIDKQKIEIVSLNDTVKKLEKEKIELLKTVEQLKTAKVDIKAAKVKPSPSNHDELRNQWLSRKDYPELEIEISKINMNDIRNIVKPWDLKPNGRTKKDLINAIMEYIKKQ